MRSLKNILLKKVKDFKTQNCSAPFTLTVFLIISMIIIFSLESIGVLRKEKNLDYRISTPEISIKLLDIDKKIDNQMKVNHSLNENGNTYSLNMTGNNTSEEALAKLDTHKSQLDKMQNIMLQAAIEQMGFEEDEIDEYDNYNEKTENQEYSSLKQINLENNDEEDILLWDI